MGAPIIDYRSSLRYLLDENTFTLALLEADPLTAEYAPAFQALQGEWMTVNTQEILLWIAAGKTAARVRGADAVLNDLLKDIDSALLKIVKGDRTDALYVRFMGNKRPSQIARPTLGTQLALMRNWSDPLKTSGHSPLSDLGASLEAHVKVCDAAVIALTAAEQAIKDFRLMGERKALFDKSNAERKALHGKLSEMPHKNPEARLPAKFADQFFRPTSRNVSDSEDDALSSEEIQLKIDALEAEVASLKERLDKAVVREEAAAIKKANREVAKAALADAKKQAAEAAAKVAELEKELDDD